MSKQVNTISRFDWVLVALVLMLMCIGMLNLYSSSVALKEGLHLTQGIWLLLGAGIAGAISVLDYRVFERWSYTIYGVVVFLLFLVFIAGTRLNGSQRWLNLGMFLLQPSELMKPAIILATARFFCDRPHNSSGNSLLDLRKPFLLLSVPALLILMQPDLGTTLMVVFIFFTIALFEGITIRSQIALVSTTILSAPLMWLFVLKTYQKSRILSFLGLEKDPYGPGWQVRQSLIAFGSGGLSGKGFLSGTQVQMGFVPYHESDFAAVNWAEEHGLIGMMLLIGVYIALIAWALHISRSARDRFGMLVAVGVASMIFWHVVVNLSMVLGMLPVVGLTLPLLSYGGSSVITVMIGIGLLMNISLRRHLNRR